MNYYIKTDINGFIHNVIEYDNIQVIQKYLMIMLSHIELMEGGKSGEMVIL